MFFLFLFKFFCFYLYQHLIPFIFSFSDFNSVLFVFFYVIIRILTLNWKGVNSLFIKFQLVIVVMFGYTLQVKYTFQLYCLTRMMSIIHLVQKLNKSLEINY